MVHEQGLTPSDWQAALDHQDACNAGGVLRALAEVKPRIHADVRDNRASGGEAQDFNTHPMLVLYVSKLIGLTRLGIGGDSEVFAKAYDYALEKAKTD